MGKVVSHLYILGTILFTVYGQLIIKWRIMKYGQLPDAFYSKLFFLFSLFLDPFVFSAFVSAFIASICWMAAMTQLELSYAYPFMALNFIFVFGLSLWFFQESFSSNKLIGILLIILGVLIIARSSN